MKKLIIFSLCILFYMNIYASDGKSFVSLRSGVSLPVGDYGSNIIGTGSFTTAGFSFGAEGAWYFWDNVGFGLNVNYSIHPVDAIGLATAVVVNDPFMEDLNLRSDPYTMLTTLGGFYYYVSLSKKITIEPSLMAGVLFGKTPFQLYEPVYFMVGPEYYKVTSSRDYGFAIKPGVRSNYQINDCIALGIYAEFIYSQLSFGFYTSNGLEYRDRKISYLDLGLNLSIKL